MKYCHKAATPNLNKPHPFFLATKLSMEELSPMRKTVPAKKLSFPDSLSTTVDVNLQHVPASNSSVTLYTKQNVKNLQKWFSRWHQWQKRIALCRVIEHCSVSHLKTLSTALEPTLHLDFSSSLHTPLMTALHVEGSKTFMIQRAADKRRQMISAKILKKSTLVDKTDPSTRRLTLPQVSPTLQRGIKNTIEVPSQVFLPALPQSHLKHKPSVASSDTINHSLSQKELICLPPVSIERKFYSVPNLHLASAGVIQKAKGISSNSRKHNSFTNQMPMRRCHKSNQSKEIELYKSQLTLISKWMTECSPKEIAFILLELVRLCNEDLLGYLVQCVYQKLQSQRGIECLSDQLLLKIFSYLDARSLCKCANVCHRWYSLTCDSKLWRDLCLMITKKEGLEDIVHTIETVQFQMSMISNENKTFNTDGELFAYGVIVDWKQAYHDLIKLMYRVKGLVLKRAAFLEIEKQSREGERIKSLTSSQFRSSMSLRNMLDIGNSGRFSKTLSTRDVLLATPESAMSKRRRERKEREQFLSKSNVSFSVTEEVVESTDNDLIEVAIDSRPSVPSLPNPDGIKALVLAGFLSPQDRPQPGKAESITLLRRLPHLGTTVLCMQCDERKIVAGCLDRLIRVYDIRTGRLVSTLPGHKGSIQCLQFDDYKIVSGSWDTTCIVWDIVNFTQLLILAAHTDCVSCLEFCNETLVTGSYDRTIKIWNIETWLCMRTIDSAHSTIITCLTFNGFTIISGSDDKMVKIWNVTTGKCQATLCHTSLVTALKRSKLLLVTSCSDGTMSLWDLTDNTLLLKHTIIANICIMDIAIYKGKIYIAGSNGVLYEWDIAIGSCIRTLFGHNMPLAAIWVGESKILTASRDQSICVWCTKQLFTEFTDDNRHFYSKVPVRVITHYSYTN